MLVTDWFCVSFAALQGAPVSQRTPLWWILANLPPRMKTCTAHAAERPQEKARSHAAVSHLLPVSRPSVLSCRVNGSMCKSWEVFNHVSILVSSAPIIYIYTLTVQVCLLFRTKSSNSPANNSESDEEGKLHGKNLTNNRLQVFSSSLWIVLSECVIG